MDPDDLCSQPHLVESERLAVHLLKNRGSRKKSQPNFICGLTQFSLL